VKYFDFYDKGDALPLPQEACWTEGAVIELATGDVFLVS
jgi:hypothetical protein